MPRLGRLFVGAISGTSVDGLDLALIRVHRRKIELIAGHTAAFAPDLQQALKALAFADDVSLEHLGSIDRQLGHVIATAIIEFLDRAAVDPSAVTAIGSHGQTIRHRPDGLWPFTMQIGDPHTIAEVTGIRTFADFRRRDIAAGGQGAPLVPPFHAALFAFGSRTRGRIVLNVGGISNVTLIPTDASQPLTGFDTGPGNALLDLWAGRHLGTNYDAGGAWGASGEVIPALLRACLSEPFLTRSPPKSTGKELFNAPWLDAHLASFGSAAPADVQATLVELTARSVIDAINPHCRTGSSLIVCGGGRHNDALMRRLHSLFSHGEVTTTDALGFNGDWIEAAAFAWLGYRALTGKPGNARAVTGARGERVLGACYPGKS